MQLLVILVALVLLGAVFAEITILKNVQVLYDRSPKIRIKGSGFGDGSKVLLSLSSAGGKPLVQDEDFNIIDTTKPNDAGITLRLKPSKKWVDLQDRVPPVALILEKVAFKEKPDVNLLPNGESIILANVLESPSVEASDQHLYMTATNQLTINGTGFEGAKLVNLYFQPPLKKEIDYKIVSQFPIVSDQVRLKLTHGSKWRFAPGKLVVQALDTGGGPVAVGNVTVANVLQNLAVHSITVEDTASTQLIYHDDPVIKIKGTGFKEGGPNRLAFSNGILGRGKNYTTTEHTATELSLKIAAGSMWRRNGENLPGYLTLLAVDAGGGFISVGPINAGKGRDVASVFERPSIHPAAPVEKIFRTHSHELLIRGTGFPMVMSRPLLRFSPALQEGVDYTVVVTTRQDMTITLVGGRTWKDTPGPLYITGINTRGDEAGWVTYPGTGLQVAEVVADTAADQTGGVEVFQMGTKVYQSFLSESIEILGKGFTKEVVFSFEPNLVKDEDYTVDSATPNKMTLKLKPGKKWRPDGEGNERGTGYLTVMSLDVGGQSYPLAGGNGIRVAVVLADPSVKAGEANFHDSQSKLVYLEGAGFTSVDDTKVVLYPTMPNSYKVVAVLPTRIRIQLNPGFKWLPPYLSMGSTDKDKKVPLQVASIDCGAGSVTFEKPITVGQIVMDRAGEVCDDSCDFAFDDVCDDGSESEYSTYYNYYQEDDYGGFAQEEFNDYYSADDSYTVSACLQGTDCTDCGGIDAIVDYNIPAKKKDDEAEEPIVCTNDCIYAHDNICDDPRGVNYCALGTDCFDCGPVGNSNFTKTDDDAIWDDDDDYWKFNDNAFMDQTKGLKETRRSAPVIPQVEPVPVSQYFEAVLLGVAYTVGLCVVTAIVVYGTLKACGYKTDVMLRSAFNFGEGHSDIELGSTQRMDINPSAGN